jgi:hypothetical protein
LERFLGTHSYHGASRDIEPTVLTERLQSNSVCAVWGGGQILGRPISPLEFVELDDDEIAFLSKPIPAVVDAVGQREAANQSLSDSAPASLAPGTTKRKRLAIPVLLDPLPAVSTRFTADWIVSAQSHLSLVLPPTTSTIHSYHSVRAIVILPTSIPFPSALPNGDALDPTSDTGNGDEPVVPLQPPSERDLPDSNLFIFPPQRFSDLLGTVTALQVGSGTFSCPDAYRECLRRCSEKFRPIRD